VLDEQVPFLAGGPLPADSLESVPPPRRPGRRRYSNTASRLDSSLAIGSHGLPLFGTGDWNDGMNRVGVAGRGESVWLGWFLHASLLQFAPIASGAASRRRPAGWRKHTHMPCSRPSSAKHGTATGIGAVILTTARPWDRSPAMNAGLIPLRSRGR